MVILTLTVPMTALAATNETTVRGTVSATYILTVPSTIDLPALVAGTTVSSTGDSISINTNVDGTVTLTVRDKEQTAHVGQMYCATAGYPLTAFLKVKCGTSADGSAIESYTPLPMSSSDKLTIVDAKPITAGVTYQPAANLYVQQSVESGAKAGTYSLVLYFVATFSS